MSFANDNFNEGSDTALENHTSDSGHTWTKQSTDPALVDGGPNDRVMGNSPDGDGCLYTISATPPNVDYDVEAVINGTTIASANFQAGVIARFGGTVVGEGYWAGYRGFPEAWKIRRVDSEGANVSELGSFSEVLSDNTDYPIRLEVRGDSIELFADTGAGMESKIAVTDATYSAAGNVGLLVFDASVTRLDTWSATDATSGIQVSLPVASVSADPGGSLGVQHDLSLVSAQAQAQQIQVQHDMPLVTVQPSALVLTPQLAGQIQVSLPTVSASASALELTPQLAAPLSVPMDPVSVGVAALDFDVKTAGQVTKAELVYRRSLEYLISVGMDI